MWSNTDESASCCWSSPGSCPSQASRAGVVATRNRSRGAGLAQMGRGNRGLPHAAGPAEGCARSGGCAFAHGCRRQRASMSSLRVPRLGAILPEDFSCGPASTELSFLSLCYINIP